MNFFGYLSNCEINLTKQAILSEGEILNYSSMITKITAAVNYLHNIGVKRKDKIALLFDNTPSFVITVFAIWKLNAIPVPLNNRLLLSELKIQIESVKCKFLIFENLYQELIKDLDVKLINSEQIKLLNPVASADIFLDITENQTALILFTSGSTGNSKAVIFSFGNLINSAKLGNQVFIHGDSDIWLASLPFFHIGGFSVITRTFLNGLTIAIPRNNDNAGLHEAFMKFAPTLSAFVSTQLKRILDNNIKPNSELRHVLLGGGFIEDELVRRAYERGWNVSKSFGTTETSSFVTALTKDNFEKKPGSSGKALLPNKIYIIGQDGNTLSNNSIGEIVIESSSVAMGYLNNMSESEKKFSGSKFFTGDYGYLDRDGYLYIEARRSDLIVSGGENINPNEVERIILKHPGIIDAAVLGIEDKEWGHSVVAAIVTLNNKQLTIAELKKYLKDILPSYKHPKKIFILKELPKTALGKIKREELKKTIGNMG